MQNALKFSYSKNMSNFKIYTSNKNTDCKRHTFKNFIQKITFSKFTNNIFLALNVFSALFTIIVTIITLSTTMCTQW